MLSREADKKRKHIISKVVSSARTCQRHQAKQLELLLPPSRPRCRTSWQYALLTVLSPFLLVLSAAADVSGPARNEVLRADPRLPAPGRQRRHPSGYDGGGGGCGPSEHGRPDGGGRAHGRRRTGPRHRRLHAERAGAAVERADQGLPARRPAAALPGQHLLAHGLDRCQGQPRQPEPGLVQPGPAGPRGPTCAAHAVGQVAAVLPALRPQPQSRCVGRGDRTVLLPAADTLPWWCVCGWFVVGWGCASQAASSPTAS